MMISMTIPTNARYSYYNGKCLLILIKWVSNSYVNLELHNSLWFWFFIYFSLSFSPLWEEGGHENKSFFASSQQQMSYIKFSPNELNIIWGDIRTVITGNAFVCYYIYFDLDLSQWPRTLHTSYLWATGPPKKHSVFHLAGSKVWHKWQK